MNQMKLSKKVRQDVVQTYIDSVSNMKNAEVRNGLLQLLSELGERLFEAPASNKLSYHNCCEGGLAEHSVRVYNNLRILRDNFTPEFSDDSIALVALFHDLGKVGSLTDPYFIPQESTWHREKLGDYYSHNLNLEYLGTAQRSLRLLEQFKVPTTELEYKAILCHDGQYIQENKPYAHKEGMLGLILHQADMLACKMEHDTWSKLQ